MGFTPSLFLFRRRSASIHILLFACDGHAGVGWGGGHRSGFICSAPQCSWAEGECFSAVHWAVSAQHRLIWFNLIRKQPWFFTCTCTCMSPLIRTKNTHQYLSAECNHPIWLTGVVKCSNDEILSINTAPQTTWDFLFLWSWLYYYCIAWDMHHHTTTLSSGHCCLSNSHRIQIKFISTLFFSRMFMFSFILDYSL